MTKIIDLDARLAFEETPVETKPVKLFGRQWTLRCDLNSFAVSSLASGDATAIREFIANLIVEDERADFLRILGEQKNFTGERLGQVINSLIEVISERPTVPPSPSSRGASRTQSKPKSPGSSSGVRAIRSAR